MAHIPALTFLHKVRGRRPDKPVDNRDDIDARVCRGLLGPLVEALAERVIKVLQDRHRREEDLEPVDLA